jgi:hypothetical protein
VSDRGLAELRARNIQVVTGVLDKPVKPNAP